LEYLNWSDRTRGQRCVTGIKTAVIAPLLPPDRNQGCAVSFLSAAAHVAPRGSNAGI
jgi:hypothetical protein